MSEFIHSRPRIPTVSIAVPMLNEAGHIEACIEAFAAQKFPLDRLDLMVIDGGSTDGSRELAESISSKSPWVRVIDNPLGSAASAFNIGLYEARGEIVCLFSSHGVPSETYISSSVSALLESSASGVGGQYHHVGDDPVSRAIGLAMVSPVGMASPHRFSHDRKPVDTISHPAYWRDAMLELGGFDLTLARNSDYEFNYRMRDAGHTLLFDPQIESTYKPRPTLPALAKQFWHYGQWKSRVALMHPGSVKARHLAAPMAAVGFVLTPFLAPLGGAMRRLLVTVWSSYALVLAAGAWIAKPWRKSASTAAFVAALPTMHGAWGAGFVISFFRRPSVDHQGGERK